MKHLLILALATLVFLCGGCGRRNRAEEVETLRRQRDRALEGLESLRNGDGSSYVPGLSGPGLGQTLDESVERPAPLWVTGGMSPHYPSARFITGIGSADRARARNDYATLALAEDRARVEAAKAVRVRITSEFENISRLVAEGAGGKTTVTEDRSDTAERINSQAEVVLEGLHIVDRWYDLKTGVYWALAALDRAVAGQAILDRMALLRHEMTRDGETAQRLCGEGNDFMALAALNRAYKSSLTLLNYRAQLRAVAPALAKDLPEEPPALPLMRERARVQEGLSVVVALLDDGAGQTERARRIEAAFLEAMEPLGLNVSFLAAPRGASFISLRNASIAELKQWAGSEADVLILGQFVAREVSRQRLVQMMIHFAQARAEALVVDLDSGRMITAAAFDWSPRTHTGEPEAALAAEGAIRLAAQEMGDILRAHLARALNVP